MAVGYLLENVVTIKENCWSWISQDVEHDVVVRFLFVPYLVHQLWVISF